MWASGWENSSTNLLPAQRVGVAFGRWTTSWALSFAPFRCSGLERLREKLFSPFPLIRVTGANNQIFFSDLLGSSFFSTLYLEQLWHLVLFIDEYNSINMLQQWSSTFFPKTDKAVHNFRSNLLHRACLCRPTFWWGDCLYQGGLSSKYLFSSFLLIKIFYLFSWSKYFIFSPDQAALGDWCAFIYSWLRALVIVQ